MIQLIFMIAFLITGIVNHDQMFFIAAGLFAIAFSFEISAIKIIDKFGVKHIDPAKVHPGQLALFDDDGKEFEIPEDIMNEMHEHSKKMAHEINERMKQRKDRE